MNRYSILAAFIIATVVAWGGAQAQTDTMAVRVGDLNVANTQGAQVALQRIRVAARQFCSHGDSRDLGRVSEQQACEVRMMGKAVRSLNAPIVTALYAPESNIRLASRTSH